MSWLILRYLGPNSQTILGHFRT